MPASKALSIMNEKITSLLVVNDKDIHKNKKLVELYISTLYYKKVFNGKKKILLIQSLLLVTGIILIF